MSEKKTMSKKTKIIIGAVAAVVLGLLIWLCVAIFGNFGMVKGSVTQADYGVDIMFDGKEILTIDGYQDCYYMFVVGDEEANIKENHFVLCMTKDGEYVEWKVNLKGELLEEKVLKSKEEFDTITKDMSKASSKEENNEFFIDEAFAE